MSTGRGISLSTLTLASVAALAMPARAGIEISVDFFRQQGVNPASPFVFYAGVFTSDPWITSASLSSSDGALTGQLGGAGAAFQTWGEVVNSATGGQWTLTLNGTRTYQFSLSLGGLTEADLPAVTISGPANGATGVSRTPSYTWNNPDTATPFDSVSYQLIKDFNGGFAYPTSSPLSLTAASLSSAAAIPAPLDAETQYGFNLIYSRNAPEISATTPVDANGDPILDPTGLPEGFSVTARLLDQASTTFTTVPEPEAFVAVAALGLLGFAALRRRRR